MIVNAVNVDRETKVVTKRNLQYIPITSISIIYLYHIWYAILERKVSLQLQQSKKCHSEAPASFVKQQLLPIL